MKTRLAVSLIVMLLCAAAAAAAAAAAQAETREISIAELRSKIRGAWAGKCIGVAEGFPTEFRFQGKMVPADKLPQWKPEMKDRIEKGWLPGMEGQARVDVGNRRLAWIWTHRFVDWTRLHLWSNPLFAPFFK